VGKVEQAGPRGLAPIVALSGQARGYAFRRPIDPKTTEAIVYYGVALSPTYTVVRAGLFCVAVTFWVLYFREILFRSGGMGTQWLKKGLTNLAFLLLIALVSSLFFLLLSGVQFIHHH
jgi:hypothetical protein